jgi:hypothetical protein
MDFNRSGLFKMISAAVLLLAIGVSAFSLVAAESGGYRRLRGTQDEGMNLRIASNYLLMRIRQFNTEGGVSVTETADGPYLVLRESIDGDDFETRIYWHENQLMEQFVFDFMPFGTDGGFHIVDLDAFDVGFSECGNMLDIALAYKGGHTRLRIAVVTGGGSYGR